MEWRFRRPGSLFVHIRSFSNPSGPGLRPGGETLPDEEAATRGKLRMVPGLRDRLQGAGEDSSARVERLERALVRASRSQRPLASHRLEALMRKDDCIAVIDQLGERIERNPAVNLDVIRPLARSIFLRTGHRGALKYATALLGFCGDPEDLPLYEAVGRHEEFTLYAAVAMANTLDDPIDAWFRLAKLVTGWGKIGLVTRICEQRPSRPDIRDWLLRHGCENSIMNEYLGLIVAQGADLVGALRQPYPGDELVRGAG
ncbi:MAG TPA: hypothetical protein VD902_07005, partial [Symbiobacteriaceae bacterium]|nr:hypothetical protein [Symbiobacteriaceae bacterium]